MATAVDRWLTDVAVTLYDCSYYALYAQTEDERAAWRNETADLIAVLQGVGGWLEDDLRTHMEKGVDRQLVQVVQSET